jgi:hypothetical protein
MKIAARTNVPLKTSLSRPRLLKEEDEPHAFPNPCPFTCIRIAAIKRIEIIN